MALAGKFRLKLARTTPLVPCARVTLPQMQRYLDPFISVLAYQTRQHITIFGLETLKIKNNTL